ncbi:MAG: primosomal protein N', partial [Syntrophomonadaceae bacterium]|nr:primosomal protein N' [Syntrophomonadaceae bacterium]
LRRLGRGTQRVEEEVLRLFPDARVRRMDADSTRGRGSHREILQAVARREVDVLIGTQMVAKGLDFPLVSLVGVVLADTVLHLPDFRAGEKAFQLLAQVAGRAGRAERPGQVVIQTYNPDSPAVRFAAAHDYQGFYEQEIHSRYLLGYPPFSRLVRVVVSGQDERVTAAAAEGVARTARELLAESAEPSQVLGPGPCPLPLLRGRFRFQVLLKGGNGSLLTSVAGHLRANGRAKHVRIDVDVDPVSML